MQWYPPSFKARMIQRLAGPESASATALAQEVPNSLPSQHPSQH